MKVLADQFRPVEIRRRFVRDQLEPARSRELAERMRMAGLSLNTLAMRCGYKVVGVFEETASGASGMSCSYCT